MTDKERQTLQMLSELLVQIRGIAGDAVAAGHVSAMGCGRFTPESACKAIYTLADAAHNIPEALIGGGAAFLLDRSLEATVRAGVAVFGHCSTFEAFIPSGGLPQATM